MHARNFIIRFTKDDQIAKELSLTKRCSNCVFHGRKFPVVLTQYWWKHRMPSLDEQILSNSFLN